MVYDDKSSEDLCLKLIYADSEEEVIKVLDAAELWKKSSMWRFLGDNINNYSVIGNQQSRPDAALVEKLVNSIDARLINQCLEKGIDPSSASAPQSIRHAVSTFFDEDSSCERSGLMVEWPDQKRKAIAQGITLSATGYKPSNGFPCFTISDCGEGQSPTKMSDTLLSLTKDNKLRIPFVQGKFNMGGTGALKFCGHHNLQLIVSRRNPKIITKMDGSNANNWSFTIVRREDPEGGRRSSVFTYLAPLNPSLESRNGNVISFRRECLPIFPQGNKPYERNSEWGTLIKLYEYQIPGRSNILMKDGLLSRMDLLLPELALPIRFHECRDYSGDAERSFETTSTGLRVRLEDDKAENLETEALSGYLAVDNEKMNYRIYVFKKNKHDTYKKNEGILFIVNGQTHANFSKDFFKRKSVGLSYISDSILVMIDCSELSGRAREDLFMNSRDRLSGGLLRNSIERELEDMLKNNTFLRQFKEKRRREERDEKLSEEKPLENIIKNIMKKSPTLSKMFLDGLKLSNPFKVNSVEYEEEAYSGKRHPTFFKIKNINYGETYSRSCPINRKPRIFFETDVENNYFGRRVDKGNFELLIKENGIFKIYNNYSLNLHNGIASLNLTFPNDIVVGNKFYFKSTVNDRTLLSPYENSFCIDVTDKVEKGQGKQGKRSKPPKNDDGNKREIPQGITLPTITKVYQNPKEGHKAWSDMDPAFNKFTALRIRHAGSGNEDVDDGEIYDFYVNVDNIHLQTEIKTSKNDLEILDACYTYGMTLIGMALIHDDIENRKSKNEIEKSEEERDEMDLETRVETFCSAISPILIPMIQNLGNLDSEELIYSESSGED